MPLQNFVDNQLPTIKAAWLNTVDVLTTTVFASASTAAQAITALGLDAIYVKLSNLAASTGASLIGFIQAGAGAVAEPVQTALRRTGFAGQDGAVGDDVGDDNVHLQALLNLGGKLSLGGGKTYRNLAANLPFVANTELWIERGTTLHL